MPEANSQSVGPSAAPDSRYDIGHIGRNRDALPPLPVPTDGVWPPAEQAWFDPGQWFEEGRRDLPLDVEIGSGKGTFLVNQAPTEPGVNFLGVEHARLYWRHACDRVRRHGIEGIRLLWADGDRLIQHHLPTASVRQLHVYFPDPWPKKRHNRRRLIQAPFLEAAWRVLEPADDARQGRVRIATDHAEYFEWMQEHAQQVAHLFDVEPFVSPAAADAGELVGTNFERKYRREGRPFHSLCLVKKDAG